MRVDGSRLIISRNDKLALKDQSHALRLTIGHNRLLDGTGNLCATWRLSWRGGILSTRTVRNITFPTATFYLINILSSLLKYATTIIIENRGFDGRLE